MSVNALVNAPGDQPTKNHQRLQVKGMIRPASDGQVSSLGSVIYPYGIAGSTRVSTRSVWDNVRLLVAASQQGAVTLTQ